MLPALGHSHSEAFVFFAGKTSCRQKACPPNGLRPELKAQLDEVGRQGSNSETLSHQKARSISCRTLQPRPPRNKCFFPACPDLPFPISALQAVTQALPTLRFCSWATGQKPGAAAACGAGGETGPGHAGQTRCFRLSSSVAQEEKEFLRTGRRKTSRNCRLKPTPSSPPLWG